MASSANVADADQLHSACAKNVEQMQAAPSSALAVRIVARRFQLATEQRDRDDHANRNADWRLQPARSIE